MPFSPRFDLKAELYKRLVFLLAVFAVLVAPLAPTAALAQQEQSCFGKVWKDLKPNDKLFVLQSNGSQLTGTLARVDLQEDVISISKTGGVDPGNVVLHSADIYQIKYAKRGKIQFSWMLAGFAAGAVAGGVYGSATWEEGQDIGEICTDCSRSQTGLVGAAIGAGAGLVLGTILSPFFKSTRTVTCYEPDPIRGN